MAGLQQSIKTHMPKGKWITIHKQGFEYSGEVVDNSYIDWSHKEAATDGVVILRNDTINKEFDMLYIIPIAEKVGIVLVKELPKNGGKNE